jgi:two-component system, LuxR family, response regulator FixJ
MTQSPIRNGRESTFRGWIETAIADGSQIIADRLEANMQESIAKCLVFTSEASGTAETVASLLTEQGIYVTQSAQADECLCSLGMRNWRFLAIDASGKTGDFLHLLSQAHQTWPDIPALVLVKQGDTHTAVQAMKAGAFDCVEVPVDAALLRSAVDALDGQQDREPGDPLHALTRVERIVLSHILDGRTNREIADILCRSPRTVEVHRRHIMQKLNASNLIELVKRVIKAGTGERQFSGESVPSPEPRPRATQTERS